MAGLSAESDPVIIRNVHWRAITIAAAVLLAGLLIAASLGVFGRSESVATQPTTAPNIDPPSTESLPPRPAPPERVQSYSDLVHSVRRFRDAIIAQTPTAPEQAARIPLNRFCYVCPRGDLWVHDPNGLGLTVELPRAFHNQVHITREQVVFVHWIRSPKKHWPLVVVRDDNNSYRLLRENDLPIRLERTDYHWPEALSIGDTIAVPCDRGVAVIHFDTYVTQSYEQLVEQTGELPQLAVIDQGFIAYVPAARPEAAGRVVRFERGRWVEDFGVESWAGPFLYLSPYADGSVLQIRPAESGKVRMTIAALDSAVADLRELKRWVEQLSADEQQARDDAHAHLTALGPSAWSAMEKMLPEVSVEAQIRIAEITRNASHPQLGRYEIQGNRLRRIWRLSDGGAVFLAEAGVSVATPNGDQQIDPGWIAVRPGRPITLLPPALAQRLAIGSVELDALGEDWILSSEQGAGIFFGQELKPLTHEATARYRKVVGRDRAGRWLLTSSGEEERSRDYLLIDPYVADPTPIIHVWTMEIEEGKIGWDRHNWPAVSRETAWSLRADHWTALEGELWQTEQTRFTRQDGVITFRQIGKLPNGSTVWTGGEFLELENPDGTRTRQRRPEDLPADVIDGVYHRNHVYLLHPQGRLSRLKAEPMQPQPLTVDAVFSDNIPEIQGILRMWVDPAERICIATSDGRLVVIFADAQMPAPMRDLIPAAELKTTTAPVISETE